MKKCVILSGAGISAESGIATFRDAGGLWEGHRIEDVATPEGWRKNPALVLDFYNQRRRAALSAQPNDGHKVCTLLEQYFDVTVITQNVDNLHEKAGSTNIIHLHGELFKCRSTKNESLVYDMDSWELNIGDLCDLASQLRPHIVWFGEMVPMIEPAVEVCMQADIFIIVGTSMQVYPAAGLINYVPSHAQIFVVDPNIPDMQRDSRITFLPEKAGIGMNKVMQLLTQK